MKLAKFKSGIVSFLITITIVFLVSACGIDNLATTNCPDNHRYESQAFSFSMLESPDIEILDYFYGIPNCPSISNPEQYKKRSKSMQGENSIGTMRRAHKLYVKWRIKSTGQEYEDTVDLRRRLPKDMTKHRVHFIVQGSQLYVYLVTPERRPPGMPPNGPRAYQPLKTLTIYPDQPN